MVNHIVCTAGHVDHGKSSLIHALTGIDPDRWSEEKERGLTIDLGFASFQLPSGNTVSFIDVPGHERFIRNMLAGVGTVDACLFVVAANEGWKPQSEEHLRILELLGIKSGIVALTKVGIADSELCDLAALEISDYLDGTFLSDAPIVKVDSLSGTGIDTFIQKIDIILNSTPTNLDKGRPRLWIDRVFAAKGSGTIVTGTLNGGEIHTNDDLFVSPQAKPVRVRALQSHYQELEVATPGSRVAVNITGLDHNDLSRGSVLTRKDQWHLTSKFDAELFVLDKVTHEVSRRGAYLIYLGSGEYPSKLRVLGPESILPGEKGNVRLFFNEELPLMLGDRFILRESGRGETIGGGTILDPQPLLRSSLASPDESIDRVISEHGWITVDHLEALTGEQRQPVVKNWIVDPSLLNFLCNELHDLVANAGKLGVDLAHLSQQQRDIVELLEGVVVEGSYLRKEGGDNLADHALLQELETNLFTPPKPNNIDPNELRELVRRGLIVEEDGIYFSPKAAREATAIISRMLKNKPEGVTVSEIREGLHTTRKYALPLLAYLDSSGVTIRRGDVRFAGKRMPDQI